MEKSILKQILLLIFLVGIFNSCMIEDLFVTREKLPPEVIDVQLWYDRQKMKTEGFRVISPDGQKANPIWPDWTATFSEEDEQYKYTGINLGNTERRTRQVNKKENDTEVSSMYIERITISNSESNAKYKETNDSRYLASSIRLIVRTNKETKEKRGFVMMIMPDVSYLEMNLNKPFKDMTYLKRGEKFSGFIFFYEMDGSLSNGWRYMDGKSYAIRLSTQKND